MQVLLDFLKKNNHWIVFLLMEVFSLVLLFRANTYQSGVWFTSANLVAGEVDYWTAEITSFLHLKTVNKQLTQKNLVLEQRVAALKAQLEQQNRKPTYGEDQIAETLAGYQQIPAKVVESSIHHRDNIILINKGQADGVKPEMGVVCGTGVVGIVYAASHHYALVMPLLNSHSNISCRIRDKGYYGNLSWDGKSPIAVTLNDIPRHAKCKKGDAIETSGHSEIFPEGLFVGRVSDIQGSDDGLFFKLRVLLSLDYSRLHDVIVISSPHREEIDSLKSLGTTINKPD